MVSLIVASALNRVIGHQNDLPWHLPADLKYFQSVTMGHPIIMGRKNFMSIPKKFRPLKGRINIVLTRNHEFSYPDTVIKHSLEESIEFAVAKDQEEVFIIGGGEVYREALDKKLIDRMYITWIHAFPEGDTCFPKFNHDQWIKTKSEYREKDNGNPYDMDFVVYDKA